MDHESLYDTVEVFRNMLVSCATGGIQDNFEYKEIRHKLLSNPTISDKIPRFVRTCKDLSQFRQLIQQRFGTYAERRSYLWSEFDPILNFLEDQDSHPADNEITTGLSQLNADAVYATWMRALERRTSDPAGAITLARTLLETICKHILDDAQVSYPADMDLPKLYRLTSEVLTIAPSQHTEHIFKQILGGCTAVIEGLGTLRNRIGDAHGQGRIAIKPAPRHAQLAVNLSGSMAMFLVDTWEARKASIPLSD